METWKHLNQQHSAWKKVLSIVHATHTKTAAVPQWFCIPTHQSFESFVDGRIGRRGVKLDSPQTGQPPSLHPWDEFPLQGTATQAPPRPVFFWSPGQLPTVRMGPAPPSVPESGRLMGMTVRFWPYKSWNLLKKIFKIGQLYNCLRQYTCKGYFVFALLYVKTFRRGKILLALLTLPIQHWYGAPFNSQK